MWVLSGRCVPCLVFVFLATGISCASSAEVFTGNFGASDGSGLHLKALTWNVAAVNNNPFEYWITHPNIEYANLMQNVEKFILDPGLDDVQVDQLFTEAMFNRLMKKMEENNLDELAAVKKMWESEYRGRKVVSQFLRDGKIGKKRLASMPDRVTNTIQLAGGQSFFRPTVINCYEQELDSLEQWFEKWLAFFFEDTVDLGEGPKPVHSLLKKIRTAKYPDVTAEEEAASIPLQLVLQGVFDAILVNLMQTKGGTSWQSLRREICVSLNSRKNERLLEILKSTYSEADIVFLQEAGNKLVDLVKEQFGNTFDVVLPRDYDAKRNQNSVIMLRKGLFMQAEEIDIPAVGWDGGDLLLLKTELHGVPLTLGSFHGDTNGLLTAPMLAQVHKHLPTKALLFGMDANTYEKKSASTAHVFEFEQMYEQLGYKSCWGKVNSSQYTTFNARTYLQPQLNKAAKSATLKDNADQNPKDFMLFTPHFAAGTVWRDNTGRAEYLEDTVFPTLSFPSDHAAIAVDLRLSIGKPEL